MKLCAYLTVSTVCLKDYSILTVSVPVVRLLTFISLDNNSIIKAGFMDNQKGCGNKTQYIAFLCCLVIVRVMFHSLHNNNHASSKDDLNHDLSWQ